MVAKQATDITMDPDMGLGSSWGPDITKASGGGTDSSYWPVLTTITSPAPPLSTVHELLPFSFSPVFRLSTLSSQLSTMDLLINSGKWHLLPHGPGQVLGVPAPL